MPKDIFQIDISVCLPADSADEAREQVALRMANGFYAYGVTYAVSRVHKTGKTMPTLDEEMERLNA